MQPFIVKFMHSYDGSPAEEMFLCLHAQDIRDAHEKYIKVTGGENHGNALVSVTDDSKVESFWNRDSWKFSH